MKAAGKKLISIVITCIPLTSYASFIETTMGTAVVNDATASYYNPAALSLLKNTQIIPLATYSRFHTKFTGQSTSVLSNITESGTSNANTNYYSPSFYLGLPLNSKIILGFAAVTNFANRNPEDNSLLRYVQSSNKIQDYDVVPSVGVRINDCFSIGAGINFSYVNFHLQPVFGFPGTNIEDEQSTNQSDGSGIGANAGFLWQPTPVTLIGFNYRSVTTYSQSGTSSLNGTTSHHYHFQMRTPARSTLSISQFLKPTLGLIATIQRIQWSIIKTINIYGVATPLGVINANTPYYLHNTWVLTLGGNYQFNPSWIVRVAGTYNQSPSNGYYQISTGSSYILGGSLGYNINKTFTLDGSYAHAFIQNETINVNGSRFLINGTNQASRDVVSLKLTVNV